MKRESIKIGDKIGYWTVLNKFKKKLNNGNYYCYYKCKCKCGNEIDVVKGSLISGSSQSCGCL